MVYSRLKEKYLFNNIPIKSYYSLVMNIRIAKKSELRKKIGLYLLNDIGFSPVQVDRMLDEISRKFRLKQVDAKYLLKDFQKLGWVKRDNYCVLLLKDEEEHPLLSERKVDSIDKIVTCKN